MSGVPISGRALLVEVPAVVLLVDEPVDRRPVDRVERVQPLEVVVVEGVGIDVRTRARRAVVGDVVERRADLAARVVVGDDQLGAAERVLDPARGDVGDVVGLAGVDAVVEDRRPRAPSGSRAWC